MTVVFPYKKVQMGVSERTIPNIALTLGDTTRVLGGEAFPTVFQYTIKTDAYTVGNKVTTAPLPVASGVLYPENLVIDWGDGSTTAVNCSTTAITSAITHTYATVGTYQVSITTLTGKIPRLSWYLLSNNSSYQLKSIDTPFPTFYDNATTVSTLVAGYQSYICSYCANMVSLPLKLLKWNPQILSFDNAFSYCSSLPLLPQDLFWYNLLSLNFSECFNGDTGLTSLPQDMFKGITNTQANISFYQTFKGLTGLTAIPRLWNNCTFFRTSTTYTLLNVFYGCSNVVTVANDLFYNCSLLDKCTSLSYFFYGNAKLANTLDISQFTGLTDVSFMYNGCPALTAVPTDYFRYNTLITDFRSCFYGNTLLATIPTLLLKYQTGTSILCNDMFQNCPKLQLIANLFCDEATEKTTRFASVTTLNFSSMFNRNTFTGTQGTAPELWSYTFGGVPTTSYCFGGAGNSATSLTNYASIPTAWKT